MFKGPPQSRWGSLPDTIFRTGTPGLKIIDIEYACLGGSISPAIGQLTALTNVSLHGNALTGVVPVEPGLNSCTELMMLKFGRNPLTGAFPGWNDYIMMHNTR